MSSTAIIIGLIGIALAIVLNYKFGVNMGVTGLAVAWIAGCIVMGLKVKDVVALWPNSVVFQLMSITLFFGFAVVNGTMQAIANHLLYKVRNQTWMIAFAIFFIGFILGALGCPPPAANAICAVIGFSVGLPAGLHPMIIAWAVCMGANLGCCLPWASQGSVVNNTIAANGYEAEAYGMTLEFLLGYFVVTFVILLILYIVFKGHKLGAVKVEKPEPFSPAHKKSLVMILIVVALVVVPSLLKLFISAPWLDTLSRCADIQMLGMVGFVICSLMKLADEKAVIRSVPWNTIVLVGGIGLLMNVATQAGVVDVISGWMSTSVPTFAITAFLCLLGGFLSFFSGGINTVFPMLAPLVVGLASSTGIKPVTMFIAILLGACFTAISPFSTGGAILMSNCADDKTRAKLPAMQLGLAVGSLIFAIVLCLVGFVGIF